MMTVFNTMTDCDLEYLECNLRVNKMKEYRLCLEEKDNKINVNIYLSIRMRKPTICLGENKGTDQLRSNCEANQRLCFRCMGSTILPLLKSEISSF